MEEVETNWSAVDADLPGDATDILGQLELMAEYFAQHPDASHRGLLLTDGIQTSGTVVLNDESLTEDVAVDLANRVPVPDLTGADVTFAGIGKVAGNPPPSSYVSSLKAFWRIVCGRTGARTAAWSSPTWRPARGVANEFPPFEPVRRRHSVHRGRVRRQEHDPC